MTRRNWRWDCWSILREVTREIDEVLHRWSGLWTGGTSHGQLLRDLGRGKKWILINPMNPKSKTQSHDIFLSFTLIFYWSLLFIFYWHYYHILLYIIYYWSTFIISNMKKSILFYFYSWILLSFFLFIFIMYFVEAYLYLLIYYLQL